MTSIMRIVTEQRNELEESYWSDVGLSPDKGRKYSVDGNHEQNALAQNTILANQDESAKLQTPPLKAPKKIKKQMKSGKRRRIFGSLRKAHESRREKQISNFSSNSKDWDAATLGVRRVKNDDRNDALSMSRSPSYYDNPKPPQQSIQRNNSFREREIVDEASRVRWNNHSNDVLSRSRSAEYDHDRRNFDQPYNCYSRDRPQSAQRSNFTSNITVSSGMIGNIDNVINHNSSRDYLEPPNNGMIQKVRSRYQSTSRSIASTAMMTKSAEAFDDDLGQGASQSQTSNQNLTNKSNLITYSYETFNDDHFNLVNMRSSSDFVQSGSTEMSHYQLSHSDKCENSGQHCLFSDDDERNPYVDENEGEQFLDTQTQVSALSMNSPTTASNRSNPTLPTVGKSLQSQKKTDYRPTNPFLCNFASVQCQNMSNYGDFGVSSSDDSDSDDSQVIELRISTDIMLPNTSTLSSQSTDIPISDEEDEEEDLEKESVESVSTPAHKSTNSNEDGTQLTIVRKVFSIMQGKIADCFLPPLNSPQTQHTFW